MFEEFKTQKVIFLGWILLLLAFIGGLHFALRSNAKILVQIDVLEQDLKAERWETASQDVQNIKVQWEKQKVTHYLANETETLRVFERKLLELEYVVQNHEDDSLEILPEIKEMIRDFLNVF
ncbi:MAG: hypothetical protein AWM53_01418 [Candidatus Dichloromethanomonas elyunquensis]|nr:MAG: hypothetical protein AWM53_01418 [Candidatus Dichloromethanomonas elyunquensis]